MTRVCSLALALVCAVMLGGCAPAPPPPPAQNAPADVTAVNAVRTAFMTAYNAGDAAAIGKLYTADAISEPNNQPTLTGREAIVASQKALLDQVTVKLQLTPEETKTHGTTGFDRGRYVVAVTPKSGGSTVTTEGRYLVLLVKEADGQWRVTRDMDNSAAPPSSPAKTDAGTSK